MVLGIFEVPGLLARVDVSKVLVCHLYTTKQQHYISRKREVSQKMSVIMDNTDCSQLVESNPNTVVHAAVCPWGKEGNPGAGGLDGTPGTQGLMSTPLTRVDVSAMPQVHKGALALTEVNGRASFSVDVERGPALQAQQASPAIDATPA